MAYTVISVFPVTVDTEEIKKDLKDQGFDEANIIISTSRFENQSSPDDYVEDVKTKNFWGYVFAHDVEMLDAYSRQSVGNNTIIVYTDTLEQAQKAKTMMNERGAIEVYKKESEDNEAGSIPEGMTREQYNGIIAKAKNDLYFLDPERVYQPNSRGMDEPMDNRGAED